MAGTLVIAEALCWMPAGWVYDAVLVRIACQLADRDAALEELLADSTTDRNGGYLDLRRCPVGQLAVLLEAAERARAEALAQGATGLYQPDFYPGFMERFEELTSMLRQRLSDLEQGAPDR